MRTIVILVILCLTSCSDRQRGIAAAFYGIHNWIVEKGLGYIPQDMVYFIEKRLLLCVYV